MPIGAGGGKARATAPVNAPIVRGVNAAISQSSSIRRLSLSEYFEHLPLFVKETGLPSVLMPYRIRVSTVDSDTQNPTLLEAAAYALSHPKLTRRCACVSS
jgi:hypothetical protein